MGRARRLGVFLGLMVFLNACLLKSPQERKQNADMLAWQQGWVAESIPAVAFVLTAYRPLQIQPQSLLTVYIEGDGAAWINENQVSYDPSPVKPVALQLALRHPDNAVAYLARPCQFVAAADVGPCKPEYWTNKRFAPEVIAASDAAISYLKQLYKAEKITLIGYSGGGAVAALVAARRQDILQLITVAGNLDHTGWTTRHKLSPLLGSLNPVDFLPDLINIPQIHYVGENDQVIEAEITQSYVDRFPAAKRPQIRRIANTDHYCCWIENWPMLLNGYEAKF